MVLATFKSNVADTTLMPVYCAVSNLRKVLSASDVALTYGVAFWGVLGSRIVVQVASPAFTAIGAAATAWGEVTADAGNGPKADRASTVAARTAVSCHSLARRGLPLGCRFRNLIGDFWAA